MPFDESFRIAEEQLVELRNQRQGRTREGGHLENQFLGQIAELSLDQEFGFLLTKEGSLLYFHANSVSAGDCGGLLRGDEVHYVEALGDTGPTATKVRVKPRG
jgi:cold shock CspA family protein